MGRKFDRALMRGEGIVVLVEKYRYGRNRLAGFLGVLPIIQADADDLAGILEQPTVADVRFVQIGRARRRRAFCLADERGERAKIAALQHGIERQGRTHVQQCRRVAHVEDAVRRLDAERFALRGLDRQEDHLRGQLLRAAFGCCQVSGHGPGKAARPGAREQAKAARTL